MNLRRITLTGLLCAFLAVGTIAAAPHDPASSNADVAAAFNQGANLFNAKRYADAIAAFTRAIGLDPSFAAAYRDRGDAYESLGRHADAVADYTAAIRLDPSDEYSYVVRASAYNNSDFYQQALTDAARAIGMDGNDGQAFLVRGAALSGLERYREAIVAYRKADVLMPNAFDVSFGLGVAHLDLCDNPHAIADFGTALRIRDDSDARNDRGVAFMSARAYGPALTDFTRAIALARSAAPLINRGLVLMHQHHYAAAEADYDAAIAIDGSEPKAYADRAGLFVLENRLPRALQDASSAVQWGEAIGADGRRLHQLDARAYRRLAEVYSKLGMPSLAAANVAAAARLTKSSGAQECPTGV